ncbi:unnamed protein product [Lota lota]
MEATMLVVHRFKEDNGSDSDGDSDASAESDEEDEDLLSKMERSHIEEMHFESQCEKCKAAHKSPEYEMVTPRKISKWRFQVQLKGEGTYECSVTGLVFEVSEQALVRYSVLSWFEFSEFLQDSWRPAGSIFDVDVVNKDASVLKFIHFPHSLCLAEPEHELSFSVLHMKGRHASIESTEDFTESHVKWRVSSLSPVGLIIPSSLQVKHHALVLLYRELNKNHNNEFIFHVFLASNDVSEIQAIEEQVNSSRKKLIKIYKSATCRLEEKFYCLKSKPEGQIEPKTAFVLQAILKLLKRSIILKLERKGCGVEKPEHELSFSVLHMKGRHASIESTVDFTESHVKWRVSSLSPVGLIIPSSLQVKHHASVLLYRELNKNHNNEFIFHVFLASNDVSEIQAIEEQVNSSRKKLIKIYKSATCRLEEKFYCLKSKPEGQIEPKILEFVTKLLASKGFFEARFGELPPFKLFLKDPDCDETLWFATIRKEDWNSEKKLNPLKSMLFPVKMTQRANIRPREKSQGQKSRQSGELRRIRYQFVQRVSNPVIECLLDDLLHHEVLSTEEKDSVMENQTSTTNKARCLIDMVIRKGERASQIMVDSMKVRDPELYSTLGLISSPTAE